MRNIKFRGLSKSGMMVVGTGWTDFLNMYPEEKGAWLWSGYSWLEIEPESLAEFTGLKDKNGVEIYEGDLLNVFFTSYSGEYNHDCIYKVDIVPMYGLKLTFEKLLWESFGHNQYPTSTTLSSQYDHICEDYKNQAYDRLAIKDSYGENTLRNERWKEKDYSNYIEVIGNIYDKGNR